MTNSNLSGKPGLVQPVMRRLVCKLLSIPRRALDNLEQLGPECLHLPMILVNLRPRAPCFAFGLGFTITFRTRVQLAKILELARCEWIERRENTIALGPSGTGKTHIALGLGLAACQKGLPVRFTTAAALVNELMEARDERRLLRLQKQLASVKLLIIDELGFVPLSKTGAELLFELISQRYERGATMITSNLPFDEWTETFGTERLTGALLDRLTHQVNILEMNGESYRLALSRARKSTNTA
jgi:DNA replication protein DnaC